jgi:hypothetical protein
MGLAFLVAGPIPTTRLEDQFARIQAQDNAHMRLSSSRSDSFRQDEAEGCRREKKSEGQRYASNSSARV